MVKILLYTDIVQNPVFLFQELIHDLQSNFYKTMHQFTDMIKEVK